MVGRVLINSLFCKRGSVNVRFAPKAAEVLRCREASLCATSGREQSQKTCAYSISSSAAASSLVRYRKSEHPCGLMVDDQLELACLDHRQVRRLRALEDAAD